MPIPTPQKGESKEAFEKRCMSDPVMKKEFSKQDQRYAVCKGQWDKKSKHSERKIKARDLIFTAEKLSVVDDSTGAISAVIRTNNPVGTWMGKMVHDLSGMFHKDKVPLDWCHGEDSDELIGFLDQFSISDTEITASGEIISLKEDDIASTVLKQLKAGIPLEASIYFGGQGLVIEEVRENAYAKVNSMRFEGPGIVVRKWPLRGVAICPHGADNMTRTSLALSEEEIAVEILGESEMADEQKEVSDELTEEENVKEGEDTKLEEKKEDALPTGKDFVDAFGTDGAVWFALGKSFDEARQLYIKGLEDRVKALTEQLKAADLGDDQSVEFKDDEKDEDAVDLKLSKAIGPSLARFASSLKFRK